jgi:hypothetical protein
MFFVQYNVDYGQLQPLLMTKSYENQRSHICGVLTLSKVNAFKLSKKLCFQKLTLSEVNGLGISKS